MSASTDLKIKAYAWYYVETYWTDKDGTSFFMCHLVMAKKPKEAEAIAIHNTNVKHDTTNAEFYMSRRLTNQKLAKIRAQFDLGTWEGWRF